MLYPLPRPGYTLGRSPVHPRARTRAHTHTALDKPENPHPHQPHCTNIALSSQLSLFFNSNLLLFSAVGTHSHLSGYTLLLLSLWCLCFLSDCIITTCGPPVCSCLHAYALSFVTYMRQSWCQAQIFSKGLLVSDQIIQ